MVNFSSPLPAGLPADSAFLPALLDLLPMGVMYYTPVTDAAGTLTDLKIVYLNPAARRMTGLPAQPGTTYRQQFPTTDDNGAWDFHRRSWLGSAPGQFQFYYDADGFDNYFRVAAQRLGEGLLTIFTDTQDEARSEMEQALRDSQARERAALAQAEATQREAEVAHADLANVFTQAPAMICIFEGPAHTFQFVNPPYQALVGERPLLGKPIAEAMPELAGQPIFGLLDQVYQTGETFAANEMLVQLDHHNEGRQELEKRYYNFIYKARRDRLGVIDGILVFAYEVTPQVQARQQVQTLNEELASINEELRATNEEYEQANVALSESQRQLQQLTQELEARVQERTRETQAARLLAEVQKQRLEQLFLQAPAAICILDGPELVYELVNPAYQQLFPGRTLHGLPLLEALPELTDQPVWRTLQQVYRTGQTHLELGMRIPVARTQGGPLEDFYFNYIQQARLNAEGQVDGVIVFAFEVSEQVLARQQVQRLNDELTATNTELHDSNARLTRTNVDLDNFIYTASHDLKAPITNIEGLLLALEHELPEAGRTGDVPLMLTMMQDAIERFQRTIVHLTDLSRLQKEHNAAADADAVALAPVVEAVRLDLTPLLAHTHGRLAVTILDDLTVTFAEKNLRSVVYNLLSNAFKYHHPDRTPLVQLRASLTDEYTVLEVQDNGLGLDLSRGQEQLFGMFQRLHTHVEGTGVGLYMVKRIVENAGGRIEVSSELGQGTTFRVFFRR